MASKAIPKTYSEQQCKIPSSEVLDPGVYWSSNLEVPNGKSEPTAPRMLLENIDQSSANHTVTQILEDQKPVCQLEVTSDNLVAPLSVQPAAKQLDLVEVLQSNETASLEVNEALEHKVSDQSSMKTSSASAKISDGASSLTKTSGSGKNNERVDFVESGKSSICRGSTSSDVSDESTCSSMSNSINKPHKANDSRWEAFQVVRARDGQLGLSHFRLLKRLGCGDIGSVYLSELSGTKCYFAMKVMDKASLASRKKLLRAQTEKEILQCLDHPFLPTLYTHFETEKFSCLVMEFCPGGDLHTLRQKQPGKYFPEQAVKFYVAEVLLALEYLHMLGIIYRDLKPENVLVREDGHIMLSDFDLSLRCTVIPSLIKSSSSNPNSLNQGTLAAPVYCVQPVCIQPTCIQPSCAVPTSCFSPRLFSKSKKEQKPKAEVGNQVSPLPELIAEPSDARSMSFVGTHEYLAPEIIKGEGHGSAVDWWTFGIFLYELLFGKTPFKGSGNRATLFNVVGQPLRFPESPAVSFAARDLIRGLLVKEPQHRLAYKRGATEIRQHPFFECVNWALIRCTSPPEIPKPVEIERPTAPASSTGNSKATASAATAPNAARLKGSGSPTTLCPIIYTWISVPNSASHDLRSSLRSLMDIRHQHPSLTTSSTADSSPTSALVQSPTAVTFFLDLRCICHDGSHIRL